MTDIDQLGARIDAMAARHGVDMKAIRAEIWHRERRRLDAAMNARGTGLANLDFAKPINRMPPSLCEDGALVAASIAWQCYLQKLADAELHHWVKFGKDRT